MGTIVFIMAINYGIVCMNNANVYTTVYNH